MHLRFVNKSDSKVLVRRGAHETRARPEMCLAFFMGIRMAAREREQTLIASLYQEQIMQALILSDIQHSSRMTETEINEEIQFAQVRMAFLKSMQERLLLAGVTR